MGLRECRVAALRPVRTVSASMNGHCLGAAADKNTMAWFLGLWGVFTAVRFVGTLRTSRALQFVLGSLAVLFFALAMGDALNSADVTRAAGIIGILCGASAMYTSLGQVLNETYGRSCPCGR